MPITVNPIYLASAVVAWMVVYHAAFCLVALARDRSLICWSLGPLGFSVIALREPPVRQVAVQLLAGGVAAAVAVYATLFVVHPAPVNGLDTLDYGPLLAVAVPVAAFTVARVALLFADLRTPLWGEARVLARVQRSMATHALVVFTPAGRAFLAERFGATPTEFMHQVRA